jgi:hypothetical protein
VYRQQNVELDGKGEHSASHGGFGWCVARKAKLDFASLGGFAAESQGVAGGSRMTHIKAPGVGQLIFGL